jgi:hypothetical protein
MFLTSNYSNHLSSVSFPRRMCAERGREGGMYGYFELMSWLTPLRKTHVNIYKMEFGSRSRIWIVN